MTLSLLFLNGFIAGFIFLPLTRLRIQERSRPYAALTFARSLGTVVVRLLFVVGFRWSVTAASSWPTSSCRRSSSSASSRRFHAMTTWRFSRPVAREMLQFGLPRVPQGLMHQGMAMSDRFFLSLYLPLEQVGLYLIGTSIASLVKLYPVAFSTAWMPFAFDSMKREDAPQLFGRLASYAFAVLAFLTLALACLAEPVVALMTPLSFHGAARVVPLLALGMAIQSTSTFLSTSINVAKRTHAYPIATAIAAAVSVTGYLVLIPRWGLFGAAGAAVAGQIVLVATLGHFAQRYFAIKYEWVRLGKVTIIAGSLYGIMTALSPATASSALIGTAVALAAYPIALLSLGFFRASELREIRTFLTTLRLRRLKGRGSTDSA